MNDTTAAHLPQDLHLLQEPDFHQPDDPHRPNRICICLSDLHFTDGTVGNQSADAVVWENVFRSIMDTCVNEEAEELFLVLAGDVVDMIRSSRWVEAGIYPWDRESEQYRSDARFRADYDAVLARIMDRVVAIHAEPPEPGRLPGFFYLLKRLPDMLKDYTYENRITHTHKQSRVKRVRTLALLGNHDKEVLVSGAVLKTFYEKCLGQPLSASAPNGMSDEYRRWIGKMYFNEENKFLDANRELAPWTPFYWGDRGFRLFVTHGHWRDAENNRSIEGKTAEASWSNADGWDLKRWQKLGFAPFTQSCWGDTVVAVLLSRFMHRTKDRLSTIEAALKQAHQWGAEDEKLFNTLRRVLDEMDLYRPTAAATKRLLQLTRELRRTGAGSIQVRDAVEKELFDTLHVWLNTPFTQESAPAPVCWAVSIGRRIINFLNYFNRHDKAGPIDLGVAYFLISSVEYLQRFQRNDPTLSQMRKFTAFLDDYRKYGFRIHSEGHTHIALQEDLFFPEPEQPASRKNYTYVNFGAWRDQVKPTQKKKYRRFGIGRALVVLDKQGKESLEDGKAKREFGYYAQDITSWSDGADAWDAHP